MYNFFHKQGIGSEGGKDKEREDFSSNLTVEDLMTISISKDVIKMVHRYISSLSTTVLTTSENSVVCALLFTPKGLSQLITARYEMLDSIYPVLSLEESSVRDHLNAYVRSNSRTIKR